MPISSRSIRRCFPARLGASLSGDALARGLWSLTTHQIRDHGRGRHRAVDDTPAGGGPGMVIRADVLGEAARCPVSVADDPRPRLYMSPRGRRLDQGLVRELADGPGAIMLCGRFEGIDEAGDRGARSDRGFDRRLRALGWRTRGDGDARCLRPTLAGRHGGRARRARRRASNRGLLEYPHYTRPREWEGGGRSPDIPAFGRSRPPSRAWRREQALRITRERRPDLRAASDDQPE